MTDSKAVTASVINHYVLSNRHHRIVRCIGISAISINSGQPCVIIITMTGSNISFTSNIQCTIIYKEVIVRLKSNVFLVQI